MIKLLVRPAVKSWHILLRVRLFNPHDRCRLLPLTSIIVLRWIVRRRHPISCIHLLAINILIPELALIHRPILAYLFQFPQEF